MTSKPDKKSLERFISIVGKANALTPEDDLTRYTHENRDIFVGLTPLVLKPGSTEEVAAIVQLAHETETALVPQGGHTGHAAGGVPSGDGSEVVVSLERMNRIRDVDIKGNTAIVEAGVILQTIQETAAAHDRLFPLSLAAEGSCQIGGNIGTNAGGTSVLAYGNTRDLILGLEVVTASGEIWNGLRRLKKDNTGYDLRDLFIGSEGTLGIVTAAVVKLFPRPKGRRVALAGLQSPAKALALFNLSMGQAGKGLTGFELMAGLCLDTVVESVEKARMPLETRQPWYILMEISSGRSEDDAQEVIEAALAEAFEAGIIEDAVISSSEAQAAELWQLREDMPLSQKALGGSIKHDISVAVHNLADFIGRASEALHGFMDDLRLFTFGHMGDGNLHYNVSQPEGMEAETFLSHREAINRIVHQIVIDMEGSISAEHGIGKLKRDLLIETKQPLELEMMRAIKRTLDPKGILNPGKVI